MSCKILFLSASPNDQERLALEREARQIREFIRRSALRAQFTLETRHATRVRDLIEEINAEDPDVLHISSHGSRSSEIILEDEHGTSLPVSKRRMTLLLKAVRSKIKVVVLNGCYSDDVAAGIVAAIDCAIGMTDTVGDEAAITFASMFYSGLGYGRSVGQSFDQAKIAAEATHPDQQCKPTIKMRREVQSGSLYLLPSVKLSTANVSNSDEELGGLTNARNRSKTVGSRHRASLKSTQGESNIFTINPESSTALFVPTKHGDIIYYKCNPQQLILRREANSDMFTLISHPQPTNNIKEPFKPEFMLLIGQSMSFAITFFIDNVPQFHCFTLKRLESNKFKLKTEKPE